MPYDLTTSRQPLRGEVVDDRPPPQSTAALLEMISYVMDRCFEIPGTNFRFGVNSLLLLIPVLGDIVPTFISTLILIIGLTHYRVPKIVAARMVLNSLLDAAISAIPVVGNVWDVLFKADTRNVRLLMEYVGEGDREPGPVWRHWVFVVGLLGLFGIVLALIVVGGVVLIAWLVQLATNAAAPAAS